MLTGILLLMSQPEQIPGGAGWAGAGLIGATLAWLFFVHLPAKDKQIKELVTDKDATMKGMLLAMQEEREKDRIAREREIDARHEMADMFQQTMSQIEKDHAKSLVETQKQHLADAERDRDAFTKREGALIAEMRLMTAELKNVMVTTCRYSGDCANFSPLKENARSVQQPVK